MNSPPNVENENTNENNSITLVKYLLTINKAYKESIDDKLSSLKQKLELNRKHQNELYNQISNNNIKTTKSTATSNNTSKSVENEVIKKHENELIKIKLNYFKDRFGSEPDQNVDTIQRNKLMLRDIIPPCKSEWTPQYRETLKQAVIKDSLRILKLPITTKVAYLEEKLYELMKSHSYSNSDLKQIRKQKKDANKLESKIDDFDETQVLKKVDPTKLDWMKISKVDLKGNWSSNECYLVWINVCHTNINQQKWTLNEDKQLIDLARKYQEKNWESIASELGTDRSAFLCIKRYHEKTADKYCKRDWSEEESNKLRELAEQHRIGLYVPYNYLCYLNGTRDRNNIYNYHLKIDPNLNHGKWTNTEEQAFEEALHFYNTVYNWQEISEYIGTRTSFQCKDRYELKYCNPEKYINWTPDEDKKLLDSYKKFENQWVKIATYVFPHRNDNSCLHRYTKLMNWRQQNVWFEKQPDEIKDFIIFLCKRNRGETQEPPLYTEDGELVPKRPIFSQNLGNIIHKIYEKKDLVYEFVRKMRQGQLSLTLLSKIGVYTHTLNMIIKKYQKHHQIQSTRPLENIKKIKARLNTVTSLKSLEKVKKEPNNLNIENRNENSDVRKKYIRKKTDEKTNLDEINQINKKRNRIRDMMNPSSGQIDDLNVIEQRNCSSLNEKLKLYQSIRINLIKNKEIKLKKGLPSNILKKKSFKISELLDLNRLKSTENASSNEIETRIEKTNELISENQATISEQQLTQAKKRGRPSTSTSNPSEPMKKRTKRVIKPINNIQSKEIEVTALKEMKINQLNQVGMKRSIQSPLVIEFETIPDGEKIPCISEQSSLFKFMYSLRKENNNSKYFYKYSIINWNGKYVAIKPYSGTVTQEYLTETRLKAIENALQPVMNILNKN